jgi:Putative transposase
MAQHWHPARRDYLVPIRAVAKLMSGKLKALLAKRRPDLLLPKAAWEKPWVVDCKAWGEGEEAVLHYLARYVFRIAITNNRIGGLDDTGVTIRHKNRKSMQWRTTHLSGHEFMRRFLQHVLPKGLHKVRYFGLWHPTRREHASRAKLLLQLDRSAPASPDAKPADATLQTTVEVGDNRWFDRRICPCCKEPRLVLAQLHPRQTRGP